MIYLWDLPAPLWKLFQIFNAKWPFLPHAFYLPIFKQMCGWKNKISNHGNQVWSALHCQELGLGSLYGMLASQFTSFLCYGFTQFGVPFIIANFDTISSTAILFRPLRKALFVHFAFAAFRWLSEVSARDQSLTTVLRSLTLIYVIFEVFNTIIIFAQNPLFAIFSFEVFNIIITRCFESIGSVYCTKPVFCN